MKLAGTSTAALFVFFMLTVDSFAQSCTSTKCFTGLFGRECVRFACSSDVQCPSDRPSCIGGICRICGGSSGSGSGIGQSSQGGPCGPQISLGCQAADSN